MQMGFDTQQEAKETTTGNHDLSMTGFLLIHYVSWAASHLALPAMAAVSTAIISLLPELVVPAVLLLELILGSGVPVLLGLSRAYLASPLWAAFKGWAVSASSGLWSSTDAVSVVPVCTTISVSAVWVVPVSVCSWPGYFEDRECDCARHIRLTSCSAKSILLYFVCLLCLEVQKPHRCREPSTHQHTHCHCHIAPTPTLIESVYCDVAILKAFSASTGTPRASPLTPPPSQMFSDFMLAAQSTSPAHLNHPFSRSSFPSRLTHPYTPLLKGANALKTPVKQVGVLALWNVCCLANAFVKLARQSGSSSPPADLVFVMNDCMRVDVQWQLTSSLLLSDMDGVVILMT